MIASPDQGKVDRFRDFVARRLGLLFDDSKRDFLADVLRRHAGKLESGDIESYFQRVTSRHPSGAEAAALIEELTVGETYFFRHPDQFRAFAEVAIPARLRSKAPRLRVLSAGCASGEEAYSLAILLREHVPDGAHIETRVTGVDVNAGSVAKATQAVYSAWSLRGMSEESRKQYFRGDKQFTLDESVRTLVAFEEHNLVDDTDSFWQPEQFEVIFCRNVLMYFTPEAARRVIARLTRSLVPDGFLFLGPAETLRGLSQDYYLRHTHETFYYQRRAGADQPVPRFIDWAGGPPSNPVAPPNPASTDDSWVTAISLASDRIAQLSRDLLGPASVVESSTPPRVELGTAPKDRRADLQLAREMVRQERFAEALVVLRASSTHGGDDRDAQLLLAVILTNNGQVAEAEQLCQAVLAGDELNAEAHYLIALCREHAKEFALAAEHDEMAIYLDPQFAMPHLHLGLLGKRAGDLDGVRRAFRQARALLRREQAGRIVLFGGGFSREMLVNLCEAELRTCGGDG